MKCKNCTENEADYENGLCAPCDAEVFEREWNANLEKELSIYNERTGEELNRDDFYLNIISADKSQLEGLSVLMEYYEDAQERERLYEHLQNNPTPQSDDPNLPF